jgi:hypothetical protein
MLAQPGLREKGASRRASSHFEPFGAVRRYGRRSGGFPVREPPRSANGSRAMGLLINILITFLVIVLILYLLDRLPIDGRAKQIVRIVVILIGILYLLRYLMTAGPIL